MFRGGVCLLNSNCVREDLFTMSLLIGSRVEYQTLHDKDKINPLISEINKEEMFNDAAYLNSKMSWGCWEYLCLMSCFFFSSQTYQGSFVSHLCLLQANLLTKCSSSALLAYRSAAAPITHKSLTNLSPFICVGGSPIKAMLQDWLLPISTISFWQATVRITRHQL